MKEILNVMWYPHVQTQKIVNAVTNVSIFTEVYITTSVDKKLGYRILTLVHWVGGDGAAEFAIAKHICDVHNDFLKPKVVPIVKTECTTTKPRKARGWPKGLPPFVNGKRATVEEAKAYVKQKEQKVKETQSNGVVSQEQKLQTENSQVQETIQPQEVAQETIRIEDTNVPLSPLQTHE